MGQDIKLYNNIHFFLHTYIPYISCPLLRHTIKIFYKTVIKISYILLYKCIYVVLYKFK